MLIRSLSINLSHLPMYLHVARQCAPHPEMSGSGEEEVDEGRDHAKPFFFACFQIEAALAKSGHWVMYPAHFCSFLD